MDKAIITDDMLKAVIEKLKGQKHWNLKLAKLISKEKEWKDWTNNECTEENARKIGYGKIKGQMHRRLFMKCAAKLIQEIAQQNEEAIAIVEQITDKV